jgi:UDP-glucose 4-epimerase
MRILVTGGLGYVGGRLCKALAREHQVIAGSRQPHLYVPAPGVKVTEAHYPSQRHTKNIECVIHLASINELVAARDPAKSIEVNTRQSLLWLRAAQHQGVKRFIYMSTAHVYGAPLAGRLDETSPTWPTHPYAISHRAMEDFVLAHEGPMECLVLRLSNSFGAPANTQVDRWSLLVNQLCRMAVEKGQIAIKSNGLQQRDFITMGDVVRAVEHFIGMPEQEWGDGLFNLGLGKSMSVYEMAKLVWQRAENIMGAVELIRQEPALGETAPQLEYCVDKLRQTGFTWKNDVLGEIDATLELCDREFKKRGDTQALHMF